MIRILLSACSFICGWMVCYLIVTDNILKAKKRTREAEERNIVIFLFCTTGSRAYSWCHH